MTQEEDMAVRKSLERITASAAERLIQSPDMTAREAWAAACIEEVFLYGALFERTETPVGLCGYSPIKDPGR